MAIDGVYCVILAGGASARFWPLDGDEHPKYLLQPDGKTSLIRRAYQRCKELAAPNRIRVVTGTSQAERVRVALPDLPTANVLVEPCRRDTLAAVAWGTMAAFQQDPDAIVVTTPADNLVDPDDAFAKALKSCLDGGFINEERLCSFGISPTSPETGFGYLERGEHATGQAYHAKRFVEKPDLATAEAYLASGDFLWNSGSFVWKAKAFLNELDVQHANARAALEVFVAATDEDSRKEHFEQFPKTSVDYGIMEKARHLGVLQVDAAFDDIGTWDALARHGNHGNARIVAVESKNCEAFGEGEIAFVGCEDLIVVREGDKTLVLKKGHAQSVKAVKEALKQEKSSG